MVLPPGINKAAGLKAALADMDLSPHNVIGIGDAENDFAFLEACGCSAAVGNAQPALKDIADIGLEGHAGRGAEELIEQIIAKDASIIATRRHGIRVGVDRSSGEVRVVPYAGSLLVCGSSGIGKSKLAKALTERMVEKQFQFCVFDPEGDYDELDHATPIGNVETPPDRKAVLKLLQKAATSAVVNTQALEIGKRPAFFAEALPEVLGLRARTGRPHWLLIDEAHHLLPGDFGKLREILPKQLPGVILITVHPEAIAIEVLRTVDTVLALGSKASELVGTFCKTIGASAPVLPQLGANEGLYYSVAGDARAMHFDHPHQEHKRHSHNYAEGRLAPDRSFFFRGPDNALNLRAHNLTMFLEMAAGVDDRTWEHHRQAGDYSQWFRDGIKNEQLAREAAEIERDTRIDAKESRHRIAESVSQHYPVPAHEGE